MSTRDEELDRVERALRAADDPYIEKPDELPTDIGAHCFLSAERVCGPDCAAFTDWRAPTAIDRCNVLASGQQALVLLQDLLGQIKRTQRESASPKPPLTPRGTL
jgi:hypothetical protein